MCGAICCSFKNPLETPLVFSWEKRKLEEIDNQLIFKPWLSYRIGRNSYAVVLYRWIIYGNCPFLDTNNGKCEIHDIKPLSCKIFPLLIGIDDNTLRVSRACIFVEKYSSKIFGSDPARVFPNEYPEAIKSYTILKIIDEIARLNNWVRVVGDSVSGELVDIDEVLDVDQLVERVNNLLAESTEKNT
ncbi:MAG: YkgJ family cysteine cluster protein [Thermoprotei archaeon]